MAKKKAKPSKPKPGGAEEPSFEESLAALEEVVADLEAGELGLDDALERYERGVAQLKACNRRLEQAERRIELLSGVDAQGNPVTEPFDDAPERLEAKAASRSRRRSRSAAEGGADGVDDARGLF